MDVEGGAVVDGFLGGGLESVAGFVVLVEDEQEAGKAVADENSFVGIPESGFASFAGFGEVKRSAAVIGLQLIFEDGFFSVHGLIVLADDGLFDIFCADYIRSLFEEGVDQLSGVIDGGLSALEEGRVWHAYGRNRCGLRGGDGLSA